MNPPPILETGFTHWLDYSHALGIDDSLAGGGGVKATCEICGVTFLIGGGCGVESVASKTAME
jgi:hypothetical protein